MKKIRASHQSDEAIYRELGGDLTRYATVLVGQSEADDVVSTVILKVLRSRSLSSLDDARLYLFRAVTNEARSRRRAMRMGRAAAAARVAYDPEIDDEDGLLDAIVQLPTRQRAAIFFFYWLDYSVQDTARALGCRPGTVKRYLHLAREKLRRSLDDAGQNAHQARS